MMFDAQVTAMGTDVLVPTPNEDGSPVEGPMTLAIALAALFPTPQGPMPVQMGIIRIPMSPKAARQLGQQLIDGAETMPEPKEDSGLVIASSMADAEAVAQQAAKVEKLKGERNPPQKK
jgi:hypothetical protein